HELAETDGSRGIAGYARHAFDQLDRILAGAELRSREAFQLVRHLARAADNRLDDDAREAVRIIARGDRPRAGTGSEVRYHIDAGWIQPELARHNLCGDR